jgi:hypothetical protein
MSAVDLEQSGAWMGIAQREVEVCRSLHRGGEEKRITVCGGLLLCDVCRYGGDYFVEDAFSQMLLSLSANNNFGQANLRARACSDGALSNQHR